MAKKTTTRKPKTNPYTKHFLHKNPFWSAASARAGEESWDAALDKVLEFIPNHSLPDLRRKVRALKSTNQRGY